MTDTYYLSPLKRFLVAYGACLPFLPICPIVADIRQRHDIEPPISRADLARSRAPASRPRSRVYFAKASAFAGHGVPLRRTKWS